MSLRKFAYPNPVSEILTINVSKKTDVEIYDSAGQIIMRKTIKANEIIDVSSYKSGFYFLVLKASNEIRTEKLIVH